MNLILAQATGRDVERSRCHRKVPLHHRGRRHRSWRLAGAQQQRGMGKMSIVGGLLLRLAVLIAEALFNAGGMPTITISR
jgi:hypothetical protein